MKSAVQEAELQLRVRELIRQGRLPDVSPTGKLWSGYGKGEFCVVCEQTIEAGEVQYEIEIRPQIDQSDYVFHLLCHAAWQLECATARHRSRNPEAAEGQDKI